MNDLPNTLLEYYQQKSKELLLDLTSINTCQPEGNEDVLVNYLISVFPDGTEYQKLSHSANRSSLVVRVPGRSQENALAFFGHIDTVSYGNLDHWLYDPSHPTIVGDRIYGRGTSDMKGGAAAMTATALFLLEKGITPANDIYFCFTADEENFGIGARAINNAPFMDKVSHVIIAEPTAGLISVGEKGALWLRVSAHGVQSHGSRPELGVNAIEMLMSLVQRLNLAISKGPSVPLFGRTTVSITKIQGGVLTNIIPSEASMELDIRPVPGQRNDDAIAIVESAIKELCSENPRLTFEIEVLNDRPAVETKRDCKLLEDIRQTASSIGMDDTLRGTIFYTDASQLIPGRAASFVIVGPGDDKLAHQTNEYITVSSLNKITELYIQYINRFY